MWLRKKLLLSEALLICIAGLARRPSSAYQSAFGKTSNTHGGPGDQAPSCLLNRKSCIQLFYHRKRTWFSQCRFVCVFLILPVLPVLPFSLLHLNNHPVSLPSRQLYTVVKQSLGGSLTDLAQPVHSQIAALCVNTFISFQLAVVRLPDLATCCFVLNAFCEAMSCGLFVLPCACEPFHNEFVSTKIVMEALHTENDCSHVLITVVQDVR